MTLFESFMEMAYKCLDLKNYNLYNYWREKAFSLSVEEAGMFYDYEWIIPVKRVLQLMYSNTQTGRKGRKNQKVWIRSRLVFQ